MLSMAPEFFPYAHCVGLTSVHDIIQDREDLKIYKQFLVSKPHGLKLKDVIIHEKRGPQKTR